MDTNIFDFLIIISGVYLIYTAIVMKTTGKITGGAIVSKDVDVDNIRDKEGFIRYMFPKSLFMGILTCIIGLFGIVSTRFNGPSYLSLVAVGCFMVILILFAISSSRARKMFIDE
ncbi:hypothetical protein [Kineothrix sp. MB12-C1]|uniref:hypothetical protein n=1 Tax=Kineothrix sp. MB12-C1 TaxID=3070215 RepID=UPI0027D33D68|nr:hypothetical protein [Kineothrix sp. MB12-C1]WMC92428.1 hypothetical protein RBB56_16545 [Kineothrix sp. MB12-C1]